LQVVQRDAHFAARLLKTAARLVQYRGPTMQRNQSSQHAPVFGIEIEACEEILDLRHGLALHDIEQE